MKSGTDNLYFLMHENEAVVILEIEPVTGSIIKTGSQVQKELLEKAISGEAIWSYGYNG